MTTNRKSNASNQGSWFPRKRRQRREAVQNALSHPASRKAAVDGTKKTVNPQDQHSLVIPSGATNSRSKKHKSTDVSVMPTAEVMPLWLTRLYVCQRNTSVVAFIFVALTLLVYGLTVYSQDLWGQSYKKLQNLQRQERQLTVTNGVLKNKMATDAEKNNNGLRSITPDRMIFLPPTSTNSQSAPQNIQPNSIVKPPQSMSPGY